MAINAKNHVVGYSTVNKADSRVHAFWFNGNGMKDLGSLASNSSNPLEDQSVALGINSDKKGTQQFGLIAEEVAEVNPDLILRDDQDTILSVRYEQINAMLLNNFLNAQERVAELEGTIARLAGMLKEQAAQIQKVSAQVEVNKPAPRGREQTAKVLR
jgi:probable HAF family extracellular repeat protein